jgi:drug/metabolite transporter (DMT)-like permease
MENFKSKKILFLGIILLVVGIILKKIILLDILGLILIITGVCLKAIYIVAKVKSGEYQPGKELIYLVVGLILFFIGLYLKNKEQTIINPIVLIILGLAFKVIFIIKFIIKVRSNEKTE